MPNNENESFVVSFKPRITKSGKKIATMVVSDNRKELTAITVFSKRFADAYMKCEPGSSVKIVTDELKDGTISLKEVG
jgi:DNA polymerase III alpha subunit